MSVCVYMCLSYQMFCYMMAHVFTRDIQFEHPRFSCHTNWSGCSALIIPTIGKKLGLRLALYGYASFLFVLY